MHCNKKGCSKEQPFLWLSMNYFFGSSLCSPALQQGLPSADLAQVFPSLCLHSEAGFPWQQAGFASALVCAFCPSLQQAFPSADLAQAFPSECFILQPVCLLQQSFPCSFWHWAVVLSLQQAGLAVSCFANAIVKINNDATIALIPFFIVCLFSFRYIKS